MLQQDAIIAAMGIPAADPIQSVQTAYRLQLIKNWDLQPGMKIMELGCGQGDMTAVLAAAVGGSGLVQAYDIAPADYGAPVTIGVAQQRLQQSVLGKQIKVALHTDVRTAGLDFAAQFFDALVITHASWYFNSLDELRQTLQAVLPFVKRVYFTEWDLHVRELTQLGHQLAALIEFEYAGIHGNPEANVRTLVTATNAGELLSDLGFNQQQCITQSASKMQDGHWEIDYVCNDLAKTVASDPQLTASAREHLQAEIELLRDYRGGNEQSLDSFTITAARN